MRAGIFGQVPVFIIHPPSFTGFSSDSSGLLPKSFAGGLGLDQIGAGAGGDEEGRAVDAAELHIGRAFREGDEADLVGVSVMHGEAFLGGGVEAAAGVDGTTLFVTARTGAYLVKSKTPGEGFGK